MTEYNTLDVKMSNSQLKKLKLEIKNCAEVTLNLSSNVISDSNDEISFPHQLFSTYARVLRIRKAIGKCSSAKTKVSKSQLSKMVRLGSFRIPSGLLG